MGIEQLVIDRRSIRLHVEEDHPHDGNQQNEQQGNDNENEWEKEKHERTHSVDETFDEKRARLCLKINGVILNYDHRVRD